MDWFSFFVSMVVITTINSLAAPMLRRMQRRDRFSAWLRGSTYVFVVFSVIATLGAFAGAPLWGEAVLISVTSALIVGLTHFLLGWAWPSASSDRTAQWRISAALAILRLDKRNLLVAGGVSIVSGVLSIAIYGYLLVTVGLAGVSQDDAKAAALTAFVWYFTILSVILLLASCGAALQSSTDEGTRAFLFTAWISPTIPGFVCLWIMKAWDNIPAVVYQVWVPGGRTIAVPLVATVGAVLVLEVLVYLAGVRSRAKRLREISDEEADLAHLLGDYQDHPSHEMFAAVEAALDRALQSAIAHTFTPMEIVAIVLRLGLDEKGAYENASQSSDVDEDTRSEPELQDADPSSAADNQMRTNETVERIRPPNPYWQTTTLPSSRWRQTRWILSWIATRDDALEEMEPPEGLEELLDRTVGEFENLGDSWESLQSRRDEWYKTGHWTLMVNQIERLPEPTVELLRLSLTEFRSIWRSMVTEVPPLKRPARWILALFTRLLRRAYRFLVAHLDQVAPFLQSMVRVVRRMPRQDLDWRHYTNIALASEKLASIDDPSKPRNALRNVIKALESHTGHQESNPFLKHILAVAPVLGPVVLAAWAYLVA